MFKFTKILMDKANPDGTPGGETPPAAAPKDSTTPPAGNPPAQADGDDDKFDEHGYEKVPETPVKKDGEATPKAPEVPAESPPAGSSATGYETDPNKKVDDPPPAAAPKVDDPPVVPDEMDKALDGLPKDELKKIKDFATKNKITTEQAKEFAALRRTEIKESQEAFDKSVKDLEAAKLKTRKDWETELKTDPDFGGEKFAKNVQQVDKVLTDFFPGLKKSLTERKAIMPPYLMRDMAKLAAKLYDSPALVDGQIPVPKEEEKTPLDEALDYYL